MIPDDQMKDLDAFVGSLNTTFKCVKISLLCDTLGLYKPLLIQMSKGVNYTYAIEVLKDEPTTSLQIGIAGELLVLKLT